MAREGVPLNVIERQLGRANLGITSVYLQGIDNSEIIDTVHRRAAPVLPAAPDFASASRKALVASGELRLLPCIERSSQAGADIDGRVAPFRANRQRGQL
jgi:hypothetical protein